MLRRIFSSAITAYVLLLGFFLLGQYIVHNNEQHDISRNRAALVAIVHERTQARVAACLQYNETQKVQTHAEIGQSHDLINALVKSATKSPALERSIANYNSAHDALIRSEHVLRDCTPAGIKKYLHE